MCRGWRSSVMRFCILMPLLFGAFLFLNGCKQQEEIRKKDQSSLDIEVPEDLKMVIGSGGGFTGKWKGYTIYGNGNLEKWNGRWEEDNTVLLDKKLNKQELQSIWKRVLEIDFFITKINENGSFISVIKITAEDLENRVTWIPGIEGIELPQHKVEEFYRDINKELNRKVQ